MRTGADAVPRALLDRWEGRDVAELAGLWDVPHLEIHRRLTSTNDRAALLARGGFPTLTLVLAEEQTAGRGRGGSRWHATPGRSVLLSLLLRGEADAAIPHLPLRAGVAVARAIEAVVAGVEVRMKWPNDLWIGSRKVGGILVERAGDVAVLGVGINARERVDELPGPLPAAAGSLWTPAGPPPDRVALVGAVVAEIRGVLGARERALPPAVRAELERRDLLAGRRVETHAGVGTARGIDADGALLVALDGRSPARLVAGGVRLLEDARD